MIQHTILPEVLPSHPHRRPIKIECRDRAVAQFRRGDGQDARPSADVQELLAPSRLTERHDLFEAEARRRMLAGSEAQPRIEYHHRLIALRKAAAPTGPYEQGSA